MSDPLMSLPTIGSAEDSKVYPLYISCHEFIMGHLGHLTGKILTIVDASFNDQTQRKAVKDLIRQAIDEDCVAVRDTLSFKFAQTAEATKDPWKSAEYEVRKGHIPGLQ